MEEVMKKEPETVVLEDMGAASETTRGTILQFPFYEYAVPPYDHWDPFT